MLQETLMEIWNTVCLVFTFGWTIIKALAIYCLIMGPVHIIQGWRQAGSKKR